MVRKKSTNFSLDVKNIIERAKVALKIKTDTELAKLLGIAQTTISTWKTRGNIDLPLILASCEKTSSDWLLYGKGTQDGNRTITASDESERLDQMIAEMTKDMDIEKKKDIVRFIEKEKLFWELKEKVNGIEDRKKAS